ncbi:DUF6233 domain-containing protein [Streptomyces sp. NPDC052496]|uniref:DUF6233 domain-containing protein n=1 Tax=Streptomyces sp. NPDC052496 TaxID=3154951 RepID=UPI0034364BD5
MTELPPDLTRLRTLETWLGIQLADVRARIQQVEQQERHRPEPIRPAQPDWLLETARLSGRRGDPLYVHDGACRAGKGKAITREEAMQALVQGVEPCPYCRPDTELGILG